MIKLKDLLVEEKVTEFTFSNSREYEKATNVLYKNDWYSNGNGNPPSSKQLKNNLMYSTDQWKETISSNKEAGKNIERLFDKNNIKYNKKYKKPYGYKVIDHGGYLD